MESMNKKPNGGKKRQKQKDSSSREPRKIEEVEGGFYDDLGFYILPDGGKYPTLHFLSNPSIFTSIFVMSITLTQIFGYRFL
jgi:hypothetical protein